MAASTILYSPGAGGKAHAESLTIGANTGDVPYALIFDPRFPSYFMNPGAQVSTATANDHLLQVMAGSSLNVRIKRIHVEQANNATAATLMFLTVVRLTTAGTGGTAVTAAKYDNGDAAAGATGMTIPTAKGTEGVEVIRTLMDMRQAIAATGTQIDDAFDWVSQPGMKPLIIPAGTANGIAIKVVTATAAGTVIVTVEFTETSWV